MADASYEYVEIRINVDNPKQTDVYVLVRGKGDIPFMIPGWHYRAYELGISSLDIMHLLASGMSGSEHHRDHCPLYWPQKAPPGEDGWVQLPERLTAENGAKAALSGEFFESVELTCLECHHDDTPDPGCETCGGKGSYEQEVAISWDTIKNIYRRIVKVLAKPASPDPFEPIPAPVVVDLGDNREGLRSPYPFNITSLPPSRIGDTVLGYSDMRASGQISAILLPGRLHDPEHGVQDLWLVECGVQDDQLPRCWAFDPQLLIGV